MDNNKIQTNKIDGQDAPAFELATSRLHNRKKAEAEREKAEADAKDRATPFELQKEDTDSQ